MNDTRSHASQLAFRLIGKRRHHSLDLRTIESDLQIMTLAHASLSLLRQNGRSIDKCFAHLQAFAVEAANPLRDLAYIPNESFSRIVRTSNDLSHHAGYVHFLRFQALCAE